jgi:hypothetical protein
MTERLAIFRSKPIGVASMNKPDILDVIGQRIDLRQRGREFYGLCPFHDDRRPSLRVNAAKQLWYCDPCQLGGDAFEFIMRLEHLSFPEAVRACGINQDNKRSRRLTARRKRAAELGARWVNEQRKKVNAMLTDAYEQRDLADELGDFDLAEVYDRQIIVLRGFYEDLGHPHGAAQLLGVRAAIEQITGGVVIIDMPPPPLPTLTPEYLEELKNNALNFEGCFR